MFLIFEMAGITLIIIGRLFDDFILLSAGGFIGAVASTLILIAYGKITSAKLIPEKIAILDNLIKEYEAEGVSPISLYREIANLKNKELVAKQWKRWI